MLTGTLTTEVDTIVGTAGNDVGTGTTATLQLGDTIIDESTTDNDVLNLTLTTANLPARIANIENINVNWDAFGKATVDAANITGGKITVSSSKLGFAGNTEFEGAGANTVVAGAGSVGTMDVNGGTKVVVDAGAAKSVTVDGDTVTPANSVSATVTAGANTTTIDVGSARAFVNTTVTGGAATTGIKINGTAGEADVANVTVSKNVNLNIATLVETLNVTAAAGNTVTLADGSLIKAASINSTGAVTLVAGSDELNGKTVTNATTGLTIDLTSDAAADLSKVGFNVLNLKNDLQGDLTVKSGSILKADVDLSANKILTGTGKTDTLTLNLSVNQTALDVKDATDGVETLTINTALAAANIGKTVTIASLNANAVVVSGADKVAIAAFDTVSIDASAVTGDFSAKQNAAAAATVVGSATGKNTVEFTATTQETGYTGGEGVDIVTLAQLSGNSTTVLGNGANTYTNKGLTSGTAVVIGGAGVDALDIKATGAAQITAQTGAGNDTLLLELGANTIAAVDFGAGNDTLTLAGNVTGGSTLTVAGGEGTDTLVLNGKNTSGGTITLTGMEVIDAGTGTGNVSAALLSGQSYNIKGNGDVATLLNVEVVATKAGSYDFSGLTLDQSLTTGIGGLKVTGSTFGDTIVGTAGADTIIGSTGNDIITGGAGSDNITLGGGSNILVFNSLVGTDTIADYVVASDSIQLSKAVFTGLGAVGALSTAEFLAGADLVEATNADQRIIHDTTTGDIYYDADGSATGSVAVKIGTVGSAVDLVFSEFSIIA